VKRGKQTLLFGSQTTNFTHNKQKNTPNLKFAIWSNGNYNEQMTNDEGQMTKDK
jgi:hypothetical protein